MRRIGRLAAMVALLIGTLGLVPGVSAAQAIPAPASTNVVSWGNLPRFEFLPVMGPAGGVAITPTGNAGVEVLESDGTVVGWDATNPPAGLTGVIKVVAKGLSFLALKSNGTVVGWTCGGCYMYPVPAGLTGVIDVAIGNGFGVALKSDGTVVAWGPDAHHETDVPVGLNAVVAIATGDPGYTVAIRADGTVVEWGNGAPAVPAGLSGVISVSTGTGFVLAIKEDHTVVAWGTDATGTAVPAALSGVMSVTASTNAAGTGMGFAVKSDGTVVGWGDDGGCDAGKVPSDLADVVSITTDGVLAAALLSGGTARPWGGPCTPYIYGVSDLSGIVAIAFSGSHGYALTADGRVWRMGGSFLEMPQYPGLQGATAIDAGSRHELVYMGEGSVAPWGADNDFQIDIDSALLTGVTQVTAGGDLSLGLKSDGTVVFLNGWTFPLGQTNPYLPPAGLTGVTAIDAGGGGGGNYVLARKSDGTVVAWGDSSGGQTSVPAGLTGVTAVAAGADCPLALKSDHTVVGWGPCTAVPAGLTGVTAIAAGDDFGLALKAGTVVAWGSNSLGQTNVPAGLTGVTAIAAGADFALALKSDGTVVAWGNDDQGQTDLPAGLTGVSAITAGRGFASALYSPTPVAATLTVSGLGTPRTSGVTSAITVTVKDGSAIQDYGYGGTVHFTSSDSLAVLPGDYTFSGGDRGSHTFLVTLLTAGTQSVTATDTVTASLTGSQTGISVVAATAPGMPTNVHATAAAGSAYVSWTPPTTTGGEPIVMYVVFSSPPSSACQTTSNGCRLPGLTNGQPYTFTVQAGNQDLLGLAAVSNSVTPSDTTFVVSGIPSPDVAGAAHAVTVTAQDSHAAVATGYRGTIHFTSSDPAAVLPADYTFTVADNGVHIFSASALVLKTAGTRWVRATDTVGALITGAETGIAVTPGLTTHLSASTANPYAAGAGHTVTVTALDACGNTATGYLGAIHFTSTDPAAVLPADYTFVGADKGIHAFSGGLILKTAGSRSVTATDNAHPSIAGSQTVSVTPGVATHLTVVTANPFIAGGSHTVTVTALDAYGNTAPGYVGAIHFTTTDSAAVLPADYTFLAADAGVHRFTIILKTAGSRSVTATDKAHATITGSQTVSVTPGAATHFTVVTAATFAAGASHTVTVTALDAYGNTAKGYLGAVHFTSTDPAAVLPADYTFLAADAGIHKFTITLKTAGSRSVTATDKAHATITGSQTVSVTPGAPTHLLVVTANSFVAGASHTLTVTALDAYGNTAKGYVGAIHITSTDPAAVLPADYTFLAADAGVHRFTITLKTAGSRSVTATDKAHATITGSQTVSVT